MFRLILSTILSFLEFRDPVVIAESVEVIVRIGVYAGQELFTAS
jgi:hypothetical protein